MKKQFFFVDAETDGLYGRFLSVAALVTDENGEEKDRFNAAVATQEDEIESDWVKENVYPYLKNADRYFDDESDMLEAFWTFWMKHRENADCVAYVPYPVESRLFSACVSVDVSERQFLGPFPLYDLASVLESKGCCYNCDLAVLSELGLIAHNAMNDVRMMAAVWWKIYKN